MAVRPTETMEGSKDEKVEMEPPPPPPKVSPMKYACVSKCAGAFVRTECIRGHIYCTCAAESGRETSYPANQWFTPDFMASISRCPGTDEEEQCECRGGHELYDGSGVYCTDNEPWELPC
mmetsp:Transcript_26376/g.47540  ORF Transcript_26376/g.47540 Transcript_26376/m.47540 type:complete len:120 (+) Transcript_26376:110-469(+)